MLVAALLPGDVTPCHSDRHLVTVYMPEGTFTLELDDRATVEIQPGLVLVEPSGINMTGSNKGDVTARKARSYVCEPGEPFADTAHLR